MTGHNALIARLRPHLDTAAATDLLARAVRAASVTGDEAEMVAMLRPEMDRLGLSPRVEEFLAGRPNITGRRPGAGTGPDLLFIGHTDVVHPRDWSDHWAGHAQQNPFGAAIIDGELWGRGAADLKAGICTTLAALDLIDRSGIRLAGSVSYAFVGDEESGETGTGISAGVRYWADAIASGKVPRPDLAVYVEPTRLQVLPVQITDPTADVPGGPRPLPSVDMSLPLRRVAPTSALVIANPASLALPAPPVGRYYARVDGKIVLVEARTELPVKVVRAG